MMLLSAFVMTSSCLLLRTTDVLPSIAANMRSRRSFLRYQRIGNMASRRRSALVGPLQLSSSLSTSSQEEESDTTSSFPTFATSYHAPVMWKECVDALLACRRGRARQEEEDDTSSLVFVDGTLGGGGHSQALLEALRPGDIVFGCDIDPTALAAATVRLVKYTAKEQADTQQLPLFVPVRSNFCHISKEKLLTALLNECIDSGEEEIASGVDGILLDLGVSSHQIDTAERGFAFMVDGPLDMRMAGEGGDPAQSAITAADICNEFDEDEIRHILKEYGDEPRARRIAQSIVERRPLRTTKDLKDAVAAVTPEWSKRSKRMGRTATLARVFQSLRIVVNQEDTALEKALTQMAPSLLSPGGRLVVLSYHSMEDRAAKRAMRDGTLARNARRAEGRDIYGNVIGPPKPFRPIGKRRKASEQEVRLNGRARSATLRVAERREP